MALAALGWLLMQALHESGHVLHAWLSGGTIEHVDLHPLRLSRTTVRLNPHPSFVAWGGAVWGCLLALVPVLVARVRGSSFLGLARALAGGCMLANGVYLGTGPWTHAGDAGDLLLAGASSASLIAFGVATSLGGLWLWNGIGARLAEVARIKVIAGIVSATAVIVAIELTLATP